MRVGVCVCMCVYALLCKKYTTYEPNLSVLHMERQFHFLCNFHFPFSFLSCNVLFTEGDGSNRLVAQLKITLRLRGGTS